METHLDVQVWPRKSIPLRGGVGLGVHLGVLAGCFSQRFYALLLRGGQRCLRLLCLPPQLCNLSIGNPKLLGEGIQQQRLLHELLDGAAEVRV